MSAPIKILLVDDVEQNLIALEALLRRDGVEILTAHSGQQALELLLAHEVALALLDVNMPEMDGFELAELMRGTERTKHVPIIFVTAGGRDMERLFRGYESGAVDFLWKPIEPRVLRGKVDVFIELDRQRRELAGALRLNEMFVGILGHDLRNPLGAILLGGHYLEEVLTDEGQVRTVRRMIAAGERMTSMIEQLLDLTRARLAGGVGFARTCRPLDVGELVQRTADELRSTGRAISVSIEGDAKNAGDADRLLQLLSNIVGNAVQHGAPGTEVAIRVVGQSAHVTVEVENAGLIPAEMLPTLFNPFRTRDARSSRGLGLGLFIAEQIAVAHGGAIDVRSAGSSTVFTLRLPRREPARSAPRRGRRVLVIDDDDRARASLRDVLEDGGYDVSLACDGREALDVLNGQGPTPDAVILDLALPGVLGEDVYDAMQADPVLGAIPIVISTTDPARAPAGALVIAKPLDPHRLLATVDQILDFDEPRYRRDPIS
jgi:two-component system sensor histidine kinase/response regulator